MNGEQSILKFFICATCAESVLCNLYSICVLLYIIHPSNLKVGVFYKITTHIDLGIHTHVNMSV